MEKEAVNEYFSSHFIVVYVLESFYSSHCYGIWNATVFKMATALINVFPVCLRPRQCKQDMSLNNRKHFPSCFKSNERVEKAENYYDVPLCLKSIRDHNVFYKKKVAKR